MRVGKQLLTQFEAYIQLVYAVFCDRCVYIYAAWLPMMPLKAYPSFTHHGVSYSETTDFISSSRGSFTSTNEKSHRSGSSVTKSRFIPLRWFIVPNVFCSRCVYNKDAAELALMLLKADVFTITLQGCLGSCYKLHTPLCLLIRDYGLYLSSIGAFTSTNRKSHRSGSSVKNIILVHLGGLSSRTFSAACVYSSTRQTIIYNYSDAAESLLKLHTSPYLLFRRLWTSYQLGMSTKEKSSSSGSSIIKTHLGPLGWFDELSAFRKTGGVHLSRYPHFTV